MNARDNAWNALVAAQAALAGWEDMVATLEGEPTEGEDGKARMGLVPCNREGHETYEYLNADIDGDGIADFWEIRFFNSLDIVDQYSDYDGDGLSDYNEFRAGANPLVADNDDTDGDGLPDWWEFSMARTNDATDINGRLGDPDGDGLTNYEEYLTWYSTRPLDPLNAQTYGGVPDSDTDTDDDGIRDYEEDYGDVPSGKEDSLSPVVWRALRGVGDVDSVLIIPEEDRQLGVNAADENGLTQDWTLETWFMLTSETNNTGSFVRRTVNKGGVDMYYFDFGLIEGVPYVRASMNGWWRNENDELVNTLELRSNNGTKIGVNVWVKYSAVWNSRTKVLTLYVNGTFAGSTYCIAAPLINGDTPKPNSFVTEIFERDGKYLAGYLDDVRIWLLTLLTAAAACA